MKTISPRYAVGTFFLAASLLLNAQMAADPASTQFIPPRGMARTGGTPLQDTLTTRMPSEIKPYPVLAVMQRVADWQLAHPDTNDSSTGWILGAEDAGMMALAGISGNPRYREAMLSAGETNRWQLGGRLYMADDHCIGQTYAELYLLYGENKMIAPLRDRFNQILAHPPDVQSLDFKQPHGKALDRWSWCDSLFMGPPTWMRLYTATGDERYMDFALTNWWRTTDYLYDTNEHLFYRDSTYFNKREPNGRKIFWSRGNGWVMAGLVRVLQSLPTDNPERPRFEQLFREMAKTILTCQQSDGLWRASLLDPEDYPAKETSGSGFFTYALAWGVNQGLLDRAEFEPAIRKGWAALVGCVAADGKLTHVQPVGSDPRKFDPDSTAPFGVGAFLLAGSEVYRLAALQGGMSVVVRVTNPANFYRQNETVEINLPDLHKFLPADRIRGNWEVMDGLSSRILTSQCYATKTNSNPNKLIFQVGLAPHETRTYCILDGSMLASIPPPIFKTFARYVPEREDDFAWESDRIAHRMYGPALETWKEEPLTSSGVDVWVKRTRKLIADELYRTRVYYDTNGPAQDDYKVGKTRGCGGLGIWHDGKLYVSKNWRAYKIITTGPIRSEFELTYDAWDAGDGRMVSETKRISIDAGSNMSRVESIFRSDDKSPLILGVGLTERPGSNAILKVSSITTKDSTRSAIDHWQNSTAKGLVVQNRDEGWMAYWQPQDFAKGTIGTAIILPKDSVEQFTNDKPGLPAGAFKAPTRTLEEGQPAIRDLLAIAPAKIGKPFVYYLGASWSESGDFPNAKSWTDYVRRFAERRDQPLHISLEANESLTR